MTTSGKKEFVRSLKFVACSVSAGVIQLASFALLGLFFKAWVSYAISLTLSVLWNFTLNRKFTFCSANNVPVAMLKVALFYAIFAPLSTWWTKVFTEPPFLWNAFVVEIATMLINFITEYLYQRFWVFGKSLDTAKEKPYEK